MKDYKTLALETKSEFIIEKSKFLGLACHVENIEEIESKLKEIKKEHYNANHHPYAYVLGVDKDTIKQSDAGEPSNTAGAQMLSILNGNDLTYSIIIVTRYFGGTKLGAGRLARSYLKAAKMAFESNKILEKKCYKNFKAKVDYNFVGKIQNFIEGNNILCKSPDFMEKVTFNLFEREDKIEKLKQDLKDITSGDIDMEDLKDSYIDFIDNKPQGF